MYTVYFNQATLIHHRAVWRPSSPPITLVGRLSTKCPNLQKLVKTSLPYRAAPQRKLQKLLSSALMLGSCVIIPHVVLTQASNIWRSKSRNRNFSEIDLKLLSGLLTSRMKIRARAAPALPEVSKAAWWFRMALSIITGSSSS